MKLPPLNLRINARDSERYRYLASVNMNLPVAKLKCPRCESGPIEQDRETIDHPGCFICRDCGESLYA